MRIILTGATSFVGRAVLDILTEKGNQVLAVVRPGSPGRAALEGRRGVRILDCALADIASLKDHPDLREGADGWLQLGWEGSGSANRQDALVQHRNIGYALAALETAAAVGCGRFLFSGSQAEYGICGDVMREDMECRPVSEYGKDKLQVCISAAPLAERLGIGYIHTRIFSVYGPGDHPWTLVETCLDAFLSGGHIDLGACTQQWNYLYITDAAMALAQLLLGKAAGGVYNVAGEDTRPLKSYIEEIHRLCGGRGTYTYGKRPPNAEGMVSLRPDITRLKAETGWESRVDFETGINSMIADGHRRIKGERKS